MATDWQTELISMKKRNANLLKTGLRSDCCFLVGVVPDNQRLFQAHKFVLSNASPVFERMFYGSIPEKENQPIEIYDIDADDFYDLLHFIYTEEISIISVDKAQQLYYAASKYMVNQLMQECIDFLIKSLTTENVCGIFEFAKQFEEQNLEEACMNVIKTKTSDVLESSALLLANISTLDAILSQDTLIISSELELFEALERYAEFRFSIDKRRDSICSICENRISTTQMIVNKTKPIAIGNGNTIDPNGNEIGSTTTDKEMECSTKENIKKAQGATRQHNEDIGNFWNLVKKIRFLTLNCTEFATGPAISKLLTKTNALNLLACIAEPKNYINHFPHGFSNSKINRNKSASVQNSAGGVRQQ